MNTGKIIKEFDATILDFTSDEADLLLISLQEYYQIIRIELFRSDTIILYPKSIDGNIIIEVDNNVGVENSDDVNILIFTVLVDIIIANLNTLKIELTADTLSNTLESLLQTTMVKRQGYTLEDITSIIKQKVKLGVVSNITLIEDALLLSNDPTVRQRQTEVLIDKSSVAVLH